jgi:hypothetical protein
MYLFYRGHLLEQLFTLDALPIEPQSYNFSAIAEDGQQSDLNQEFQGLQAW